MLSSVLLDAYCRDRGIPLSELFGGAPTPVTTDITVPIVTPDAAAERATRAATAGFDHIKVKPAGPATTTLSRQLRSRTPHPTRRFAWTRTGWTPKATEQFVDEVTAAGVDLALVEHRRRRTISAVSRTRDRLSVPVAADEAVFTPADATAVVRDGTADVII